MNTKKLLLLLVAMTMVFSLTALAAKAPATVTSKTVKLSGKFDKIAVSSGLHSQPQRSGSRHQRTQGICGPRGSESLWRHTLCGLRQLRHAQRKDQRQRAG